MGDMRRKKHTAIVYTGRYEGDMKGRMGDMGDMEMEGKRHKGYIIIE